MTAGNDHSRSGYYENVDGHQVFVPNASPQIAPAAPDSDQQALPGALADFLRLPDVWVQPDELRCAVVIAMPAYRARALAHLHPDPLQVLLAAKLIEAAEADRSDMEIA